MRSPGETSPQVSVIIPAYNEGPRIGPTVRAVRKALADVNAEILVVDDGSPDDTAAQAESANATKVIRQPQNRGKGEALMTGIRSARGEILLLLDGDLGDSAAECDKLLGPVLAGEADMAIARFPALPSGKGGMGSVVRLARWGSQKLGGQTLAAPLSGQRALTRSAWERLGHIETGFGAEVGLNIDALRAGLRVVEVQTQMSHRVTGRDWRGFVHRGRQFAAVARVLLRRWVTR